MRHFVGSHTKELDAKSRVMIPLAFRNALRVDDGYPLILRPSPRLPCLEGWPPETLMALVPKVETINPFDDEEELHSTSLFGMGETPKVDGEGRMIIPEHLAKRIGIEKEVMFIGLGYRFQIWEPKAGQARLDQAAAAIAARAGAA